MKTMVTNLGYLFREKDNKTQICFGEIKKEGFSKGFYNGFGGKVGDKVLGETVEEALVREAYEELSVTLKEFNKISITNYFSDSETTPDVVMHMYFVKSWLGEPTESNELIPDWFDIDNIPYSKMWPSDRFWFKDILKIYEPNYFDEKDLLIYDVISDAKDWNIVKSINRFDKEHNNSIELKI